MSEALSLATEKPGVVLHELVSPYDDLALFDAIEEDREHLSRAGNDIAEKYPNPGAVRKAREENPEKKLRLGIWDNDRLVGMIGAKPSEDESATEIGYWLRASATGNGYATVAVKALTQYVRPRFPRVFAEVHIDNPASARVLERAGYTKTGETIRDWGPADIFEPASKTSIESQHEHKIRAARLSDIDNLHSTFSTWIRNRYTGEIIANEITELEEEIRASIESPNNRNYFVAEDIDGTAIGVMGMQSPPHSALLPFIRTENPMEIINAYVSSHARLSGAGQALAEYIEQIGAQAGHTELVVNSGPRYADTGWPFWTKLYGKPIGVAPGLYGLGGDAVVWRKSLNGVKK